MADRITYSFSEEKNAFLKKERGISFDDVIFLIENGGLIKTIKHPSRKYSHQEIALVRIDEYVYCIPIVRKGNDLFMKTIYPSRVYTKKYLSKDEENG